MSNGGNTCRKSESLVEQNILTGGAGHLDGRDAGGGSGAGFASAEIARLPEGVRASVCWKGGEYDARRLRSQREVIRDVMLSAAECETWLTLGELRALTRYGEASISAQLRHLRKSENGGYEIVKRHREGVSPARAGADGRGECVWEYWLERGTGARPGVGNSGTRLINARPANPDGPSGAEEFV